MNHLQISTPASGQKVSYVLHSSDNQFGSTVTFSWFKNKTTTVAERMTESFEELAMRCRTPEIRPKNDGPTFSPFTFRHGHFHEFHAQECNFLAFKFEKARAFTQPGDIFRCVDGLASFVFTTHSHCGNWGVRAGSYQLVVALRTPIPSEYYKVVAMNFATRFFRLSGIINASYMSWNQRIQFPSCPISRLDKFGMGIQAGRTYDWLPDVLTFAKSTSLVNVRVQ